MLAILTPLTCLTAGRLLLLLCSLLRCSLFLYAVSPAWASPAWANQAVNYEQQSISIALTQEPPSLNSMQATDQVSLFILGHVNEGLVRYDPQGRLAPGVAESWSVTPNKITFTLRDNARWSDGTAVTAHDFVFAWQQVNAPALASPYAAVMRPIKNAEQIQQGKLPVTRLGAQALDEQTLVVTLENPCGYCLALMTHGTFFPVQQVFYEAQGQAYSAGPQQLLANGPFKLSAWTHEASMTLEKNEYYWNAEAITLNRIEVAYMTADNRARFNLFRDRQIAFVRLDRETIDDALQRGLRLRTFQTGGLAYIWFNMRAGRATAQRALRQAIQAAFDPERFVNQVIAVPGYKPATSFFPSWLAGVQRSFVEEYPPREPERGLPRARQLMALVNVKYQTNEATVLTMLTLASPTGMKTAEYLQGMLQQTLGLNIKIDQQSFKQYLYRARRGDFDLAISSWYPDFDDIVTYADLLASWNPNNRGGYLSPEYDAWLFRLQAASVPEERYAAAAELQRIILAEVPVLPMAETGSAYLQAPKLRGVLRNIFGPDPDYTHARVLP